MKDCKGTNTSTDRLEGAYIRDRSLFFSVGKIQRPSLLNSVIVGSVEVVRSVFDPLSLHR